MRWLLVPKKYKIGAVVELRTMTVLSLCIKLINNQTLHNSMISFSLLFFTFPSILSLTEFHFTFIQMTFHICSVTPNICNIKYL